MCFLRRLAVITVLLLPMVGSESAAQDPAASEATGFDGLRGHWVLATRDAEARRDAAVETAIADMGALVRAIARRRLSAGMPIPRTLVIDGTPSAAHVQLGLYDATFGLSARPANYEEPLGGDSMRGTHRMRGSALVQRFASDDASLTHSFVRRGDHIDVRITITSDRLPADASYRLRFRQP